MRISRAVMTALVLCLGAAGNAAADNGIAAFDKAMQPVVDAYLKIHASLSGDRMDGVADAAKSIAQLARKLDASKVTGENAAQYRDIPQKLVKSADALAKETTLKDAREKLKELGKPMALWATLSKPAGIWAVYCSMAPGSWLQKQGEIRNPYYGAAMLNCGQILGGAGAPAR